MAVLIRTHSSLNHCIQRCKNSVLNSFNWKSLLFWTLKMSKLIHKGIGIWMVVSDFHLVYTFCFQYGRFFHTKRKKKQLKYTQNSHVFLQWTPKKKFSLFSNFFTCKTSELMAQKSIRFSIPPETVSIWWSLLACLPRRLLN